eukprot:9504058-Pyramimonas_sp.AAC.3
MERVSEHVGCPEPRRLRGGRPAPSLAELSRFQYAGNFASLGFDCEAVRAAVSRAAAELGRFGLAVANARETAEGACSVLGWDLAGTGRPSASQARLRRARLAIRRLLQRGRCRGSDLEKVLGHFIFIALVPREGLSLFEACPRFAQTPCRAEVALPKAVRAELCARDGLAPLLWRDLRAGLSTDVGAVDASPWCLGACQATWSASAVSYVGRFCERRRFGRAERPLPRRRAQAASRRALGQAIAADVGDPASGGPGLAAFGPPAERQAARPVGPPLERDLVEFPEVPRSLLHHSTWTVTSRRKWDRVGPMPILGPRAVHYHLRHAFGMRAITLRRFWSSEIPSRLSPPPPACELTPARCSGSCSAYPPCFFRPGPSCARGGPPRSSTLPMGPQGEMGLLRRHRRSS